MKESFQLLRCCLLLLFTAAMCSPGSAAKAVDEPDKKAVTVLVPNRQVPGEFKRVALEHKTLSPDGSVYAGFYLDGWDETISIHDSETGKQILRIVGHGDHIKRIRFSPNGKLLATWSAQRGWKLWSVTTGKLVIELPE